LESGLQHVIETDFIEVAAGDEIKCVLFSLEELSTGSILPVTTGFELKATGTNFSNDVQLKILPGATIEVSEQLPDITQLELMQALRDKFNLYIQTDTQKREIIIEPRDNFYLTDSVDWTDKLDKFGRDLIDALGGDPERLSTRENIIVTAMRDGDFVEKYSGMKGFNKSSVSRAVVACQMTVFDNIGGPETDGESALSFLAFIRAAIDSARLGKQVELES